MAREPAGSRSTAEVRKSPQEDTDNHDQPPAKKQKGGNEEQTTHRRQAACQVCRLRKVKCDKKRPTCALCKASGALCEYLGDSGDKITLETATSTILERLDQLQQELAIVKQTQHEQSLSKAQHQPYVPPARHFEALPARPISLPTPSPSSFEPSRDFLRIPPHRGSADTILLWEVFEHKYPPNAIIGYLFSPDHIDPSGPLATTPPSDLVVSPTGLLPLEEEQIPHYVDRFLQNSYTKNPIIDVETLVKQARQCADQGVGWDGWSCLVLLACALGCVAKPFDRSNQDKAGRMGSSARLWAKELQQGDSCFTLACRRLGSLKYSLLGAQCHFFAGVYLMYTLRPIQSWHYFYQASIFCQFYLRQKHGLSDTFAEVLTAPSHTLSTADRKARRLEQSLYWSCFKSECEFRVELPLPQSEISLGEYPNLFPSPPSPAAPSNVPFLDITSTAGDVSMGQAQQTPPVRPREFNDEQQELRQHASRLCNEEESWYYYLTEIALRRISNRIINSFFNQERSSWLNIRPLLRIAQEFEAQVSSWSAHLPPAMQQYETSSIIRAPHLNYLSESAGSHVSRELSWAIDNRLLEMQTWLYQPFLYYLIHQGPHGRRSDAFVTTSPIDTAHGIANLLNPFSPAGSSSTSLDFTSATAAQITPASTVQPLDSDDLAVLHSLIASGIDCCFKTIEVRSRGHRHHGLWYDLRSLMSASLILLAIVKSGNESWIPGGADMVWGSATEFVSGDTVPIGGKLGKVLGQFEFWATEAQDMMRHRDVLETVVRDVRGS